MEQLVRHAQPELKEKRPRKKLMENLQPLGKVLRDLEVDIRTNPNDSYEPAGLTVHITVYNIALVHVHVVTDLLLL